MNLRYEVNGKIIQETADPLKNLAEHIREELNFKGCKISCREGECGACSVLVDGKLTLSCITPLGTIDGCKIQTVEGIREEKLFKIIEGAFLDAGAVQCGFCTPGMMIAAYALLNNIKNPTVEEIKIGISGNICRCTGYNDIIQGIRIAAERRGDN